MRYICKVLLGFYLGIQMKKSMVLFITCCCLCLSVSYGDTIAHWRFSENGGQEVANSAVGGSDTIRLKRGLISDEDFNDPDWVTDGLSGSAMRFEANVDTKTGTMISHAASCQNSDFMLLNTPSFTIEMFFKLDTVPDSNWNETTPYYLMDYCDLNSYHRFAIRITGKTIQYYQQDNAGNGQTVSMDTTGTEAELTTDQWFWIAVTRNDSDGATAIHLFDTNSHVLISSIGTTATPFILDVGGTASPYFAIGAQKGGGAYFSRTFDGIIDEVRISDTVLLDEQMLYNQISTCKDYLPADLNKDCYINTADLALFSEAWLECNQPEDPDCLQTFAVFATIPTPSQHVDFGQNCSLDGVAIGTNSAISGLYAIFDSNTICQEMTFEPFSEVFTISLWLKVDYYPDNGQGVWDLDSPMTVWEMSNSDGYVLLVRINARRLQIAGSNSEGNETYSYGQYDIAPGQWYNVQLSYDGTNLKTMVNGHIDSTAQVTLTRGWNELRLARQSSNRKFRGALDEVRIYNGIALSSEQVSVQIIADSGYESQIPELYSNITYAKYPAMQVTDQTIHPFQDQLHISATIVPWSSPKALDLLVTGSHGSLGSRIAVYYAESGATFPYYDQGHTVNSKLTGNYFQSLDKDTKFDLIARGVDTIWGNENLIYYKNVGSPGTPQFSTSTVVYVDGQSLQAALGKYFSGWYVDDFTDDGVEDLLVTAYTRTANQYWPDSSGMWDGILTPNMGPDKGYDIQGKWLGLPTKTELYWAKGQRDSTGDLSFADLKKVHYRMRDFAVQWISYETERSLGAIEVGGQKYLLHTGSVDKILAMPIHYVSDELYCMDSVKVISDNSIFYTYFPGKISVKDIDADGLSEILLDGNPGRIAVLKGSQMGQFKEVGYLEMKGGFVAVDTLATPCRADWNDDGFDDLIIGDASGWLTLWPGTSDASIYGNPVYMTENGRTVHVQAGPSGSFQGINEARWGYLQPTVGDWDNDGSLEIITNDILGQIKLYQKTSSPNNLSEPVVFTRNGTQLPAAWRSRPAIIPSNVNYAGDNKPCLLYLDYAGDLAIGIPDSVGDTNITQSTKLLYNDNTTIHLCGPEGFWGRTKLAVTDWDGDGIWDILFGTNGSSQKYFIKDAPNSSAPYWMKNVGTATNPRFRYPHMITLVNGQAIDLKVHNSSVWPTDLNGDNQLDLIIGAEDGKVYKFYRSELAW